MKKLASLVFTLCISAMAQAQVSVSDAWIRATVPGQRATGAFMTLRAATETRLIGVSSPVAALAEVHEMKMEGDVMRMRAMPGLDLPAGKPVELKPGGYHLMLLDLRAPLKPDTTVPVSLLFQDAKGVQSRQELQLPVRTLTSSSHHKH